MSTATLTRERWLSEWEEPAGSPTAMVTFQDEAWLQRFGLPNESNVVDYLRPSAFMPTATDEELVVDRQATVPSRDAAQPDTLVVRRRNANDETLAMCVRARARDFQLSLSLPISRALVRVVARYYVHRGIAYEAPSAHALVASRVRKAVRAIGLAFDQFTARRRAERQAAEAAARDRASARAPLTARDVDAPPLPPDDDAFVFAAALREFRADLVQAGGRWADAVAVADGTPAPPRDDADAEDASARVPPAHRGAAWQALEVAVAGVREVGIDGA